MSPWTRLDHEASTAVLDAPGDAAPEPGPPARRHAGAHAAKPNANRRWWMGIGLVTLMGFGIRLATVLGRPHRQPGGDGFYYHNAANLLVAGKGFIDPWHYYLLHPPQYVQQGDWPPLFVFVLAMASLVGFKSFFAHRVWCCIVGAAAVTLCGVTGREIAGRRAGLIAAFFVAVYPNIWMSDELALSETLTPLLVAFVLLAAYRFWNKPGWGRMLVLGVALGVTLLGRDELALLIPLVLVPLALFTKVRWRTRLALAGVGTLMALTVVAPWVGYNMARFQKPTFISTGFGITLASANCNLTWSGPTEGYWALPCSQHTPLNPHADKSVQSSEAQAHAMKYIRAHASRLWRIEFARLGRAFGAYHPLQQVWFDYYVETRPYHWALVGLGSYYFLAALSVGGVVILRRRRVPVLPLIAIGLDVAATVLVTFGQTRYRTAFEVSLVLLGAVSVDWICGGIWRRLTTRWRASGSSVRRFIRRRRALAPAG